MPVIPWTLTRFRTYLTPTTVTFTAHTSIPAHLFLYWNTTAPINFPIPKFIRGKTIICGYKYIWNNPNLTEQMEPGDTLIHTFHIINCPLGLVISSYLWAPGGPFGRQIQGPLITVTLPPSLNIGAEAIDRVTVLPVLLTQIQATRPATRDGQLTIVEIWAHFTITGCKVGTFARYGDMFTCRDWALLGTVLQGEKRTFSDLAIDAKKDDYIGIYGTAGHIDIDMFGGEGIYYAIGDHFDGAPFLIDYYPGYTASLGGWIGDTPPPPP